MTVYEILKQDHQEVSAILKKLSGLSGEQKKALYLELKEKVKLHMYVEETYFYPVLKDKTETSELALESYEEHRLVKTLLEELDDVDVEAEDWDAKLKVLQDNIEHHVDEEENEMFPKARKIFSNEQAEKIGVQISTGKAELMATKP